MFENVYFHCCIPKDTFNLVISRESLDTLTSFPQALKFEDSYYASES